MNTLSEIEKYYKAREQQLLKKLHRQEAALAAAEQTLKRLNENQKAPMDETTEQRTAQEQAFKEKLYRDPLTGIYNRRYYEEVVRKSIGPAGIALIDVDDFKICNDTYGHYAGDMALKTVANTIQSCIRASDLLIRYGGDEFLLVLSCIPGDFLQTKLEQIRTAAQMASVPGYSHFRISLSIGGTIQSLADPMENIVRRADWLMYQAKCRKNAVTVELPENALTAQEELVEEKPQILLVDDSEMNRMMLTEILGDSYHVLEAENGQQAIEMIEKNSGIMYDPRVASAALAHWDTLISRYTTDTPRTPYFDRLMLERTRQAHDYLVAHQDSRITLAELAAKFHLSQSSLKLCFKALYGVPVAGYLRTVRMDTATRLLQESDLPVAEIAHRVGYEDPSRFSAAFRRHTGRRPTELRRVACPCAE